MRRRGHAQAAKVLAPIPRSSRLNSSGFSGLVIRPTRLPENRMNLFAPEQQAPQAGQHQRGVVSNISSSNAGKGRFAARSSLAVIERESVWHCTAMEDGRGDAAVGVGQMGMSLEIRGYRW